MAAAARPPVVAAAQGLAEYACAYRSLPRPRPVVAAASANLVVAAAARPPVVAAASGLAE